MPVGICVCCPESKPLQTILAIVISEDIGSFDEDAAFPFGFKNPAPKIGVLVAFLTTFPLSRQTLRRKWGRVQFQNLPSFDFRDSGAESGKTE